MSIIEPGMQLFRAFHEPFDHGPRLRVAQAAGEQIIVENRIQQRQPRHERSWSSPGMSAAIPGGLLLAVSSRRGGRIAGNGWRCNGDLMGGGACSHETMKRIPVNH